MKPYSTTLGAVLISLAASSAMAELAPADKTFATKAASGGRVEVVLGRLAIQNAAADPIKQFGQQMVTDHTEANQELLRIAKRQDLTLPTTPDEADHATERRLSGLKGQAFDDAYIRDMVEDHRKDLADFRKEAETGQDPELKSFAAKYLPVLEKHLRMAEAAQPK